MNVKKNQHADESHTSLGAQPAGFSAVDMDSLLVAQRRASVAFEEASRRVFQGWAQIAALQTALAHSLVERGVVLGTNLSAQSEPTEMANRLAEAGRAASEDILRSTREIVNVTCGCCVDAIKALAVRNDDVSTARGR